MAKPDQAKPHELNQADGSVWVDTDHVIAEHDRVAAAVSSEEIEETAFIVPMQLDRRSTRTRKSRSNINGRV